ncbi:hypothetical protein [Sphingomonas faeni]|uniref:hypothetical protein n=1 Tax=Sphingomonas faeni TaxID=185950 RepID=UPI0033583E98
MIAPDAPLAIRVGRAIEEATIGKRAPDDDFVSVMMANHARKIMAAMLVPDMAVTMAFHNAIGRPVGVSAEEVWTAMITAAIGTPYTGDED